LKSSYYKLDGDWTLVLDMS